MELKSRKNVLCLIVVGLLDLCVHSQSDVMGAERRGVFSDLQVSRFLQSRGRSMWVMCGFKFRLCLSQLEFWSAMDCHLPSFDLSPLSRNLSFISFFSSDQIRLGFLCFLPKVTDWLKNYFNYFLFFDKFHRHFAMCWSYVQKLLFSILKKVSAPITSGECFLLYELQSLFCVLNKLERDLFRSYNNNNNKNLFLIIKINT